MQTQNLTFESLPNAVSELITKVDYLTKLVNQKQHPDQCENEFLSIDEACKFLNLAKPSIYSMVSRGTLPYIKRGGKLRFQKSELVNYLKDGKVKTAVEVSPLSPYKASPYSIKDRLKNKGGQNG
ncbi:MAG: helix-turn-helix domain-containing protein [Luteibaculaceae bacterium]